MTMNTDHRKLSPQGFTLIELVVVMAVIGLLASLLIPAVHMARESVRQTACNDHVRELVIAMQQAIQINRVIPHNGGGLCVRDATGKVPGMPIKGRDGTEVAVSVTYLPSMYWPLGVGDPNASPVEQTGGWAYATLPFIEQIDAFRNRRVDVPLPLHSCASDPHPNRMLAVDDAKMSHVTGGWAWTKTDYAANNSIGYYKDPRTLEQFEAFGLDNVILLGEKAVDTRVQKSTNWYHDEPIFSGGSRAGSQRWIELARPNQTKNLEHAFGSYHHGVNVGYFSGRTELLSFDTDPAVLIQKFPDVRGNGFTCGSPLPEDYY